MKKKNKNKTNQSVEKQRKENTLKQNRSDQTSAECRDI